MGRTNVFARVSTPHRDVTIGGRKAADSMTVWLNTDNAGGSDCNITLSAEVFGHGTSSQERKKDGDQRKTLFTIELPDESFGPEHVEVHIREHGAALKALANIGLMLASVKGVNDLVEGKVEQGKYTLEAVAKLAAELDGEKSNLPRVILPTGVTLEYALQCVEIVKHIRQQHSSESSN